MGKLGVNQAQGRARTERLESLVRRLLAASGAAGSGGFAFTVINAVDANAAVGTSSTAVFFTALTVDRTATLPAAPVTGQEVVVKDGDGSLAAHNIIINGNGKLIDGAATYTMTLAQNGLKGSVSLIYNGTSWGLV